MLTSFGLFHLFLILYSSYIFCNGQALSIAHGEQQSCDNEGEEVNIKIASRGHVTSPCFRCFCVNGTVDCQEEKCGSLANCPVLEPKQSTECCRSCRKCHYTGQFYENNDHWRSSQDACRTLTCKAGVITLARMQCVTTCKNPQRLIGYCCPVCPISNSVDLLISGVEMQALLDPCVRCQCDSYLCHCYRTACPALNCVRHKQHVKPGSCCPECLNSTDALVLSGGKCSFQGNLYNHHQNFRPDPCTLCKCEDGSVICKRFVCPPIDCPVQRLYYDPNLCCPFCRDRDPLPCQYTTDKGVTNYKHGESWADGICTNCSCINGETKCSTKSCPHLYGCPRGYRKIHEEGKCCFQCLEKEATCTVFGDPHYQTFDGKAFNFQGTCRYTLSKECLRNFRESDVDKPPSFMVIAHNEPRGSKRYAWTHRLSVHIRDSSNDRIIRVSLLPKKKVKINRRVISLPYVKLFLFNIRLDNQGNVDLTVTSAGVKVIWDGFSYVEVTANAKYKGRLCGLCGNYNHNKADDLTTSDGQIAKNVHSFAQSWIYRSHRAFRKCKSPHDRKYHKKKLEIQRRVAQEENEIKSWAGWVLLNDKKRAFGAKNSSKRFDFSHLLQDLQSDASLRKRFPSLVNLSSHKNTPTSSDVLVSTNFVNNSISTSVPWPLSRSLVDDKRNSRAKKRRRKDRRRRRLRKLCSTGDRTKWKSRKLAVAQCRLLKSDLFLPCRRKIKVSRFFRWCIEDACACPASGRCYCESLLAYSRKCEVENIYIEWRSLSKCNSNRVCPMKGGVFSSCSPVCPAICAMKRSSSIDCDQPCRPGCNCPNDTVLYNSQCIPKSQCPFVII